MYLLYFIFKIKHYYFITKYLIILKLLSTIYLLLVNSIILYILFLYKVFGVAF